MSNNFKPKNFPQLFPYLVVRSPKAMIEFYQKAFGFELTEPPAEEDGEIQHAEMHLGDAHIMFCKEGNWGGHMRTPKTSGTPAATVFYIYVPDIDALYAQAIAAGATSVMEPNDAFWGDRMATLRDPDGHEWSFATTLSER